MNTRYKIATCSIVLILLSSVLSAQDEMWPGGRYDPNIPTPKSLLGYEIGERHTPHYLLEKYLFAMAEASDRVAVEAIGETYQGRNQYHVIISSPENMARLEDVRASIRKLTDPSITAAELDQIVQNTPAIALLNYTIHGNEGSGTEASLRTVYQLAAGQDDKTLDILSNVVTIINPTQNPDGHDRYVNFVNGYLVAQENPDGESAEHDEPWPGGRTNAYYFDLNRDWFLMTQIETVHRMRELLHWLPQVAPDLHEMGTDSTYFFAPPMDPVNKIIPEVSRKWWEIYGQANADAFDRFGWGYYTRESFDEFYSGYGGSMPTMYGSIAMTYEQASARGRISERRDGTTLSLHDGTWHHFVTSMATLQTTAERKEERLRDFHSFFVEIIKRGAEGPIREFYIPPSDPFRFNKLVQRLQIAGAEVFRATATFTVNNAYDYYTKKTGDVTLPEGSAIIPLDQMAGTAIQTMLEPESVLDEEFLKEERKRIDRNESGRIYDITGWSMPLTYGIKAHWAPKSAAVEKELIPEITCIRPERESVPQARVGYLIPPDSNANIALVARLMCEGFKVRVARKEVVLNDKHYPSGTAVLLVNRNPDTLHGRLNELINETGGYADATDTGYSKGGGIDIGSNNVRALKQPKIAILADMPTSGSSFGEIRYLFEQVYKVPYTAIRAPSLASADLKKYNVLILPHAWSFRSFGYKTIFGKAGIEKLKNWVRDGGILICIGGAVDFAIDKEVKFSKALKYTQRQKVPGEIDERYQEEAPAEEEEKKKEPAKKPEPKFEVDKLLSTPGAILKVNLDDRSLLSWGYDGTIAVLVASRNVFVPISEDQGEAAGIYAPKDEIRLAGHVWEEMLDLLPGKAYVWRERFGSGQVICFAENPLFRASYDGLERLFFNAVFFTLAFAP